jgi:hypothetical protein
MLSEADALRRFLSRLSPEAREAIRILEVAGSPEIDAAVQRVDRVLVNAACVATTRPETQNVRHSAGTEYAGAKPAMAGRAVASSPDDVIALAGELD